MQGFHFGRLKPLVSTGFKVGGENLPIQLLCFHFGRFLHLVSTGLRLEGWKAKPSETETGFRFGTSANWKGKPFLAVSDK